MANQSKINTVTFEHDGNSIRLRASLANLNSLEEDTGTDDVLFYLQDKVTSGKELARLFYHLQVPDAGAERAIMDDIFEWFFCDLAEMMSPEWQNKLQLCFAALFGSKLQQKLIEAQEAAEKAAGSTEKKVQAASA